MSGPAPDILGDLEFLEHHWGSAYSIGRGGGQYTAERRDGKTGEDGNLVRLTAPDRDGLMDKIQADYEADPVSRDVAADILRRDVP